MDNDNSSGHPCPNAAFITNNCRTIWQGILDFQEISNHPQGRSVTCTFPSTVTSSEDSDVNADNWPGQLVLQWFPTEFVVLTNLLSLLKIRLATARHVFIHFSPQTGAFSNLGKNMSSRLAGFVRFPPTCDIRIMVVLNWPNKQTYMGFIAPDQERFFNSIKQNYETYCKQKQQQRQRPGTNSSSALNQPPYRLPQASGPPASQSQQHGTTRSSALPQTPHPLPQASGSSSSQSQQPGTSSSSSLQQTPNNLSESSGPSTSHSQLPGTSSSSSHHRPPNHLPQTSGPSTSQSQQPGTSRMGDDDDPSVELSFSEKLLESKAREVLPIYSHLVKPVMRRRRFKSADELCGAILDLTEDERKAMEEEVSEYLLCKVCMDKKCNMLFEPCDHLVTCMKCANCVEKCPICRCCITKKKRIYMS